MKTPKLTVVGAGPGDEDLITIKGLKAVQTAGAILYDALVNEALLTQAPKGIPIVFVGKRKGKHTFTQDQINELIVEHAHKYGNVIRLKGGDPYVFGRGYEEVEYAKKHSLEIEYIPGITSAIGVLGLLHIPVTFRGLSESFWVITGTTSDRQLSEDIKKAVSSTATVIILMGFTKLQEIVNLYKEAGKNSTPIAIIQKGSTSEENIAIGSMDTIVDVVKEKQIAPPAVIVIGEVVRLHY